MIFQLDIWNTTIDKIESDALAVYNRYDDSLLSQAADAAASVAGAVDAVMGVQEDTPKELELRLDNAQLISCTIKGGSIYRRKIVDKAQELNGEVLAAMTDSLTDISIDVSGYMYRPTYGYTDTLNLIKWARAWIGGKDADAENYRIVVIRVIDKRSVGATGSELTYRIVCLPKAYVYSYSESFDAEKGTGIFKATIKQNKEAVQQQKVYINAPGYQKNTLTKLKLGLHQGAAAAKVVTDVAATAGNYASAVAAIGEGIAVASGLMTKDQADKVQNAVDGFAGLAQDGSDLLAAVGNRSNSVADGLNGVSSALDNSVEQVNKMTGADKEEKENAQNERRQRAAQYVNAPAAAVAAQCAAAAQSAKNKAAEALKNHKPAAASEAAKQAGAQQKKAAAHAARAKQAADVLARNGSPAEARASQCKAQQAGAASAAAAASAAGAAASAAQAQAMAAKAAAENAKAPSLTPEEAAAEDKKAKEAAAKANEAQAMAAQQAANAQKAAVDTQAAADNQKAVAAQANAKVAAAAKAQQNADAKQNEAATVAKADKEAAVKIAQDPNANEASKAAAKNRASESAAAAQASHNDFVTAQTKAAATAKTAAQEEQMSKDMQNPADHAAKSADEARKAQEAAAVSISAGNLSAVGTDHGAVQTQATEATDAAMAARAQTDRVDGVPAAAPETENQAVQKSAESAANASRLSEQSNQTPTEPAASVNETTTSDEAAPEAVTDKKARFQQDKNLAYHHVADMFDLPNKDK